METLQERTIKQKEYPRYLSLIAGALCFLDDYFHVWERLFQRFFHPVCAELGLVRIPELPVEKYCVNLTHVKHTAQTTGQRTRCGFSGPSTI